MEVDSERPGVLDKRKKMVCMRLVQYSEMPLNLLRITLPPPGMHMVRPLNEPIEASRHCTPLWSYWLCEYEEALICPPFSSRPVTLWSPPLLRWAINGSSAWPLTSAKVISAVSLHSSTYLMQTPFLHDCLTTSRWSIGSDNVPSVAVFDASELRRIFC